MSLRPLFDVTVIPRRTYVCVVPRGELDLATCGTLDAQLDELWGSGWEDVVVDLRQLDFMDSSGLHVLIKHHRRAAGTRVRFSIIDGAESVSRLLQLTGVDAMLTHAPLERVGS